MMLKVGRDKHYLVIMLMWVALYANAQSTPAFTSAPLLTGTYGAGYTYSITTSDVENNSRSIAITSGVLPIGLALGNPDLANGTAQITGTANEVGDFPIVLTVSDQVDGTQETQSFTISISKATAGIALSNINTVYNGLPQSVIPTTTPSGLNVIITYDGSATPPTDAGSYAVVATLDDAHYSGSKSETLFIDKATLTATGDAKNRFYGAADPAFTITYSGFVNGESQTVLSSLPTAAATATATSAAGAYPITVTGGVDENYTINPVAGTFTINKAPLTATADDKGKLYGAANPPLTISYTGFANGETSVVLNTPPTISTSAVLTSAVGDYSITLAGGTDDNYSINNINGVLTINKATITATADNKSRNYGVANPTFTFTYSGFVNGETVAVINSLPVASSTALINSPVDTYAISAGGGTDNNYLINLVNGTLTITKATPVITWNNPSSIDYETLLSTAQLNASANVSGTFTYTPSAGTILNAGNNQILSADFVPSDVTNYTTITGIQRPITVNKITPLVTWANPATITYGTALSSTQLNATANVAGSFSYAPGEGTILNAATNQALSVNFTPTDVANYNVVPGTQVFITVTKATPVITWSDPSDITYNTLLSSAQLNATADAAGTFAYTPSTGTKLNAGPNQTLSVNFVPSNPSNFNSVNNTQVSINVNKATPAITWANPAPIIYGQALSSTQLNATANAVGTFTYTPNAGTQLGAGINQTLSVSFAPTDAANFNAVNDVQRQITVNKATPLITWANPSPIIYGTLLSATQLNATASVPGTFSYTPDIDTKLNAGVNQILTATFTPTDATNYNIVTPIQRQITVSKSTPVITWAAPAPIKVNVALSGTQLNAIANVAGTFTYTPPAGTSFGTDGTYTLSANFTPSDITNYNTVNNTQTQLTVSNKENPVITWANPSSISYGNPLSGTQLNATANVTGTFTYTPSIGSLLNAGANQNLKVDFVPADGVNYNTISKTVQITIDKTTLIATASNGSRVYGAANPVFSVSYSGFVNNETSTVLDTPPSASCSAIASDNAGNTFPIIPSGGVDNNYSFNYVNGQLTITKATLTARADNKSRSYGLANPSFTISYTGFVNGDNANEITAPSIVTTATTASNVGAYPITLSGGSATNYNFTLQSGSLTINISPLTVKANDLGKTYGQANPALTLTYTGFLNGDTPASIVPPTVATTALATSNTGTYPISLSGGSALNYGLILQPGTLTVAKAPLTATADNKTKNYGQTNPALTITYSGFVNGQTASSITAPSISTTATTLSSAGSYSITLSGGSAANYELSLQNGSLTINKIPLTITLDNKSKPYGSANPGFTFSYSGFVNGESYLSLTSPPIPYTTATITSSAGSYPITAGGAVDNNYSFNYLPGTLTVNKVTLTAKANNISQTYGTTPAPTISYTGFANGEDQNVLDTKPQATTTATPGSAIGTYPITVSGGADNNYNFTYSAGTLTITKATLTVTANNLNRLFNTANPPLTISYSGFVNNETIAVINTVPVATTSATISSPGGSYPIIVSGGADDRYEFNYVFGTLLVIVNNPPVLAGFQITVEEDTRFLFTYDTFSQHITDDPGNQIVYLKILTLPANGTLYWKGNNVAAGDNILATGSQLDNFSYLPNTDYNGLDSFNWNASDGTFISNAPATVSIKINGINDAPVLSNIESEPIPYSLGDKEVAVTQRLTVNDIDNSFIHSAKITIAQNYSTGDNLSVGTAISPKIISSFDATKGELTLTGKDSKSNYEATLGQVVFNSPVSGSAIVSNKTLTFVVNDSTANSNIVSRIVEITEVFPELDLVNSFTPNNDGVNDQWDIGNLHLYSKIAISVFNPEGMKVFTCGDQTCKWDGKSNGRDLPQGPYFYTINLNDGKRKYQGTVTILK